MKTQIILTRNFKGSTSAKYCAAVFGEHPETAVEIDDLVLENVKSVWSHELPETLSFHSFGCGVLLVGEGELPAPAPRPATGKLDWNGHGFRFQTGEDFTSCSRLQASPEGLEVLK